MAQLYSAVLIALCHTGSLCPARGSHALRVAPQHNFTTKSVDPPPTDVVLTSHVLVTVRFLSLLVPTRRSAAAWQSPAARHWPAAKARPA